jgi:hypothetical protein
MVGRIRCCRVGSAAGPAVSVGYLRLAEHRTASRHTCTRVGPPDRFNARVVPRRSGEQRIRGTELSIVALLLPLGGGIVWYYQHALETWTVATPAAGSASETHRQCSGAAWLLSFRAVLL